MISVDQILLTIKQLKQVTPCCINWLCLSLLCIKYMLSGHSAAQKIKQFWKATSGFIGPQLLDLEESLDLSPGPQSCLVSPCKNSLGGPAHKKLIKMNILQNTALKLDEK